MGCLCSSQGYRKLLTDGGTTRPTKGGKKSTCEVLADRQVKNRGSILPNNTGRNPTEKYDMGNTAVGAGAFGTVRKGTNKKTKSVYAIKQIKKAAIPNMDAFLNEVELNTAMDHPNIVRLYETFEDANQVYLVMEICDGGELFDAILDAGAFTERDAAIIVKQVLSAVYYMHCQQIAHRDLKPENFLLQNKGRAVKDNALKVIDFGIASKFNHKVQDEGSTIPDMKTMVGTAYYVAPEVLSGKYCEKCDVWSIGVILYILLSGSPPFAGESDQEIMANVKKGTISFDLEEFSRVSQEVKKLILKMCTKSAKSRPSAGQALNSSWLQSQIKTKTTQSAPLSGAVVSKLKAFSSVNRFKKAALQVIAHHLDDKQIAKLRDTFQKLDGNGDGVLTLAEIKEACASSGLGDTAEMKQLFEQLDVDGSGEVGYTEFLAGMIDQKNYLQEELVWEAFRTFDRDNSGEIELAELKEMLRDNDTLPGIGQASAEEIFRQADENGDGKISFQEFMAMLRKN